MALTPLVIESPHSWPKTLAKATPASPKPSSSVQAHPWCKFLRLLEDTSSAQLQTSKLIYRRKDGARIDLISAIHIGEKNYYQGLNKRFKNYEALLYEKLNPHSGGTAEARDIERVISLQHWMKDKLNLELQTNGIDYQAKNFIHADLDLTTLAALQSDQGESFLKLMQSMQQVLDADTDLIATTGPGQPVVPDAVKNLIYDAQGQQRDTAEIKLLLARQLQDVDLIVSAIEGIKGTVVLRERNKHAIEVLLKTLDQGRQKIGIFYGVAHMMEIAQRLTEDLGFTLTHTYWYTAWDIQKNLKPKPLPAPAAYSFG